MSSNISFSNQEVRFVDQHRETLISLGEKINRYEPDYIIAVSRSGPRVLEMLEKAGIYSTTVPIYTEKSLDFVPKKELEGKRVIVFDDITITGTTIWETIDLVQHHYDTEEIIPLTIGYDKDTAQMAPSVVQPQLELSASKRHEFIKQMTQSFSYLNKPYDIDHAIINLTIDKDTFKRFEEHNSSYELTTVHQRDVGQRRFTFIPDKEAECKNLLFKLFDGPDTVPGIEKFRVYHNEKEGRFVIVPIVTFSLKKDAIRGETIFSDSLPREFNEIVETCREICIGEATSYFYNREEERVEPVYRLIWYLVSYLYGIAYQIEYEEVLPSVSPPGSALNRKDMVYLFGETVTDHILSKLNNCFESTIKDLQELLSTNYRRDEVEWTVERIEPFLDSQQEDLYNGILPYLQKHVNDRMTYSDKLSTVFEGIQLEFESKTDRELQESTSPSIPHRKSRNTALNVRQLKNLLLDADASIENETEFSLAMDFLIDAGVQIPCFYYRDDTEQFERSYRHGEGALNRMGYEYVVDEVIGGLFNYAHQKHDEEIIPRILLEKVGVMITDRLHKGRFWEQATTDAIYESLAGNNQRQEFNVAPQFYRHGRVVLLEDEREHQRWFFTDWCKNRGLIKNTAGGVMRSTSWQEENNRDINEVASTISSSERASLEVLAQLLYEIDKSVDPANNQDYLTALTTCRSEEAYVQAIRKEIQLFLSSNDWSISDSIDNARRIHDNYESYNVDGLTDFDLSNLQSDLDSTQDMSSKATSAINGIQNKQRLREELNSSEIITKIREHFESHPQRSKTKQYEQNLEPYLDAVEEIKDFSTVETQKLIEKTESFGKICIQFCEVYRNIISLSSQVAAGGSNLRVEFTELQESISKYNKLVDKNKQRMYSGIAIDDLPRFEEEDCRINNIVNGEFKKTLFTDQSTAIILINDLFPKISNIHDLLIDIYDQYFEENKWNQKIQDLFEKESQIEAHWVVWYDIRDSSNPENKEKTKRLKNRISEKLDVISTGLNDGEYEDSDDDETHIFIRESKHVLRYLSGLLEVASFNDMNLRMSVCRVPSGYIRKSANNTIKSNKAHVRSVRIGEYLNKTGAEVDSAHYISITNSAKNELYEDGLPESILQKNWSVTSKENSFRPKDEDVKIDFTTYELDQTT
ncbi:phosphoribosyltransferase [Halorubrum saccharovorum]|uniref:phosphoribosyltransferase n=1 Tax=Halorubrum saccharovorum TaxID=2248 RepID=UPI001268443F|nr:phosphoribosyltransferase [Halorubrum saccharovorum]